MQSILFRFHVRDHERVLSTIANLKQLDPRDSAQTEISAVSELFRETDKVFRLDGLLESKRNSFNAWFKVLFDSSSEGIEDTILRYAPYSHSWNFN